MQVASVKSERQGGEHTGAAVEAGYKWYHSYSAPIVASGETRRAYTPVRQQMCRSHVLSPTERDCVVRRTWKPIPSSTESTSALAKSRATSYLSRRRPSRNTTVEQTTPQSISPSVRRATVDLKHRSCLHGSRPPGRKSCHRHDPLGFPSTVHCDVFPAAPRLERNGTARWRACPEPTWRSTIPFTQVPCLYPVQAPQGSVPRR